MNKHRLTCTCGTRVWTRLAKLPPCQHVALTQAKDPAFAGSEHDFYKYWTPRVNLHALAADRASRRGTGGGRRIQRASTKAHQDLAGLPADQTRHELASAGFVRPGVERGLGPAAKGPIHSAAELREERRAERDEIRAAREGRQLTLDITIRGRRRREWASIIAHLGQATDKQREAYRLHIEQGLTFPEVASRLGISQDAVKDRLKKARQHEQTSQRRAKIA